MKTRMFGGMSGSCSGDIVVSAGATMEIDGSLSGDVEIEAGGTLICKGSLSGDVEIGAGGSVVCYGSCSGDIDIGTGGSMVCHGPCSGDVEIGTGGSFTCKGSCSGDVDVSPSGSFLCDGTMSGDVEDNGGRVVICGSPFIPGEPDYILGCGRFARTGKKTKKAFPEPRPSPSLPMVKIKRSFPALKLPRPKSGWKCKICGHVVASSFAPQSCAACGGVEFDKCLMP